MTWTPPWSRMPAKRRCAQSATEGEYRKISLVNKPPLPGELPSCGGLVGFFGRGLVSERSGSRTVANLCVLKRLFVRHERDSQSCEGAWQGQTNKRAIQ